MPGPTGPGTADPDARRALMFARALLAFLAFTGVLAFAVPLAWWSSSGPTTLGSRWSPATAPRRGGLLCCVRDFYVSGAGTLRPGHRRQSRVGGLYR